MTTMKILNASNEILLRELRKSKSFCEDLQKALDCIPETSVLGRLGIIASLKRETKRYFALFNEAKERNLI